MNTGLERRIAREQPDALDLLGMDRMIRRAYEAATSNQPAATTAWHDAEVRAAAKRREETPYNEPATPAQPGLLHAQAWPFPTGARA